MILTSLQPLVMNRSLLSNETPLEHYFIEACFSIADESWREMGRAVCDSIMREKGELWENNARFILRVSFEKECYGIEGVSDSCIEWNEKWCAQYCQLGGKCPNRANVMVIFFSFLNLSYSRTFFDRVRSRGPYPPF